MEKIPRVAIVHDWLTGMRGGEKVLRELVRLIPQADLWTMIHARGKCDKSIETMPIRTSWLSDLPGVRRYYRHLLPLMPLAMERIDAAGYDLIVSSSHCVAKGIGGRRQGQLHVCYCYTPMRYAWHGAREYRRRVGPASLALRAMGPLLRAWDRRTAGHVDLFIAISACVAQRIREAYGRPAAVLYPPADVDFYTPAASASSPGQSDHPGANSREDFYLMVSALTAYKRADLAIEAFARLGRQLKIIGSGPELRRLRRTSPPNVELLGWRDDATVRDHYRRCKALIFPQLEDFGIVPLEATACGAPVIAYAAGGAMETVLDAADPNVAMPTGLLFSPQTPEALTGAVLKFDELAGRFDTQAMRAWACKFSNEKFRDGFRRVVGEFLAKNNCTLAGR